MGIAIDRTTLEVFESVNTPDYSASDFLVLEKGRDNSDYEDLVSRAVKSKYWKIDGANRLLEMTALEKEQVDLALLPKAKEREINKIETQSQTTLSEGFEYPPNSGVRFSLNQHTRTLILGMVLARDSIPYPLSFNTLDQRSCISLASPEEVLAFFASAVNAVLLIENAATLKKEVVRAASSLE